MNGQFEPGRPEPPPKGEVHIKINRDAYQNFDSSYTWPPSTPNTINTVAVFDTGAQTCTAGTHILNSFTDGEK